MAAQYDVNLEKYALLKCLCGSAFAAGQAPVSVTLCIRWLSVQYNNKK